MKIGILAASTLLSATVLAGSVQAADIAPELSYDWSGPYVGLNAGAAWNNTDVNNSVLNDENYAWLDDISNSLTDDDVAFTAGALIGYNWQMDSVVIGAEADISYLGFSGERDREVGEFDDPLGSRNSLSFEANWFGTLRARAGFAADNFLIYGTGGLAYGHLEADAEFEIVNSDTGAVIDRQTGSVDEVNWGWTAGAGVEYGIDNWSLGLEYLYVDLGEADWNDGSPTSYNIEGSVDYQFSVVRATAKIRF